MRLIVLIAGLGLYAAALFAPAIIFKPDARSNPKRSECGFAVKDDVMCESFAFGGSRMTSCQRGQTSGRTFVDKAKILDYCKGWDQSVASVLLGYQILPMGVLGVFLGMFAWFANLLMLAAVLLSAFGKRLAGMMLSLAAIALGLQSYAMRAVPFNEASMAADNLNVVDRLGLGFYLWMASLLAFTAYCFLKKAVAARP
ncbi:MAG TPA: hypothetical protein VGM96_11180 [Reyranella sp.]